MPTDPAAKGVYPRTHKGKTIYWLSYQKNHKRSWVSLETSDYATAIQRAVELRRRPELNEGGLLKDEIKRYVAFKVQKGKFSRSSEKNVPYFLNALPNMFGNIHPARITQSDAMRFYTKIRSRVLEKSAQDYVGYARAFYTWAINTARICNTNPFVGLELPKVITAARKEFCRANLRDKLIAECPRDDLRFVLYCGFHAGLRRNEIMEARPEWFDLDGRMLHIKKISPEDAPKLGLDPFDLKDREERSIPLSKEFTAFLTCWINPKADYCLAPGVRRRKNRYRYDIRRPFEDYMEKQECSWVTMHTMRRTFASILASRGTSIYFIAKWLGDDVETTTNHYAHLAPAHDHLEKGLHGEMD